MGSLSSSTLALTEMPAWELAQLVRSRQISPVELLDAHLRRIEECNPRINAFAHLNAESARAEAKRAEAKVMAGQTEATLLGVPVTIKSSIDVQGLRCEAGSRLRDGYIAADDATLVARLKRSGAIVIGNTSTPELLIAYHTANDLQGKTNNPWDLERSAGGSSGGEAAAISCGMSSGGIGSDGGGSIRVPAHFCGICGLKPTPGRVPATGHYPPCGGPFSLIGVVGPMARTVQDLRLLFEAVCGYDPGDPVSSPVPVAGSNRANKKLRIGFYTDDEYSPPSPEIRDAVLNAAEHLSRRGFEVEPFRPDVLNRARELWATIFVEAIAMVLRPMVNGREDDVTENTREFLALADEQPPLTGERLLNTLIERDNLRSRLLAQMEGFPVLLAPVCSVPAFRHEDGGWGTRYAADYMRTMSYSQHYNLLGNPAAVVPIRKSAEGLPVGVQIIGRPYGEDEVLSVADILDQQFGWQAPP